jgi:hypothetical protein
MKVYVASSWRNESQPGVVQAIRAAGHQVYDFRNPNENNLEPDQGFHWSHIDPEWQTWSPLQFVDALDHPLALAGYGRDYAALESADAVVLVMPCGRSAHLELGFGVGMGKLSIILLSDGEPELMYKMVPKLVTSVEEVIIALDNFASDPGRRR